MRISHPCAAQVDWRDADAASLGSAQGLLPRGIWDYAEDLPRFTSFLEACVTRGDQEPVDDMKGILRCYDKRALFASGVGLRGAIETVALARTDGEARGRATNKGVR